MDAKHSLGEPRALISRQAILHNARLLRRLIRPETKLCAIVKADAYGHGAEVVVDTLCNFAMSGEEKAAVDALAVASIDEAAALPPTALPILIFRPVENAYIGRQRSRLEAAIRGGWTLTLCSAAAADDLARIAVSCDKRAVVQVMIDTGMARSGASIESLPHLLATIRAHPSLKLAGLCTHFACSEDAGHPMNANQLEQFIAATDGMVIQGSRGGKSPARHAANSGAIFFHPQSHFDMIRPGLSLYGIDPTGRPGMDRPLRPAMKWTAPLLMTREVKKGDGVGYGQTWHAPADTRIGLVPVGYADGYLRSFSNRATMLVGGRPAPVVGRVSMDLTTIDLGNVPHARIGDEVIVLDDDPLSPASVYALAVLADTIPYEIFCRIGGRVHRVAADGKEFITKKFTTEARRHGEELNHEDAKTRRKTQREN